MSTDIFDVYEVESARNNVIAMEINIDLLYNVLKNFERANSEGLHIRLQRKLANDIHVSNDANNSNNSKGQNKRLASLAITYNELINSTTQINHSFKIPIRLLKKESDERIIEPELSSVDLLLKLPENISSLFRRIDRFKNAKNLTICGDKVGDLSLILNEDDMKVILSWNEKLLVQRQQQQQQPQQVLDTSGSLSNGNNTTPTSIDANSHAGTGDNNTTEEINEIISVDVKLKDWKFGAKCCELCSNVVLILSHPYAVVLHCYLDDTDDVEIIYYINGITTDDDI